MATQIENANSGGVSNKVTLYVNQQLEVARRQVKSTDLIGGVLTVLVIALSLLLLMALWDAWIAPFSETGRWVCLFIVLITCVGYIATQIAPLLLKKINPDYAARMIEQAKPGFKNSLLNYLALRKRSEEVNQAIFQAVSRQAAENLRTVPADATVDRSKLIFWGFVLVGLMVFTVGYKMLSPKDPLQSFFRILAPAAKLAHPARVSISEIKPGDTKVYFGDQVEVTAVVRGNYHPTDVFLNVSTSDGQLSNQRIPMEPESLPNRFRAVLGKEGAGLQQSLTYEVTALDGISPKFEVVVQPNPTIAIETLTFYPPKYTKLPVQTQTGQGEIHVLEGTKVVAAAIANLPIGEAHLDLLQTIGENAAGNHQRSRFHTIDPIAMQVDGAKATASFWAVMDRTRDQPWASHYQIRFISTAGDRNQRPNVYPIKVTPDLAPEIRILDPRSTEVSVPANGALVIDFEANDLDFEITEVQFFLNHRGHLMAQERLPLQEVNGRQRVRGRYVFEPHQFRMKAGDTAIFFLTAADNRTVPADENRMDPNVTRTENFTVSIAEATPPQDQPNTNPQPGQNPNQPQSKNADEQKQDPAPANEQDNQNQSNEQPGNQNPESQPEQSGNDSSSDPRENPGDNNSPDQMNSDSAKGSNAQQNRSDDNQPQDNEGQGSSESKSDSQDDSQSQGSQSGGDQQNEQGNSGNQQSGNQSSSGSQSSSQNESENASSQRGSSASNAESQNHSRQSDSGSSGTPSQTNPPARSDRNQNSQSNRDSSGQSSGSEANDAASTEASGTSERREENLQSGQRKPLSKDATQGEQIRRLDELLNDDEPKDSEGDEQSDGAGSTSSEEASSSPQDRNPDRVNQPEESSSGASGGEKNRDQRQRDARNDEGTREPQSNQNRSENANGQENDARPSDRPNGSRESGNLRPGDQPSENQQPDKQQPGSQASGNEKATDQQPDNQQTGNQPGDEASPGNSESESSQEGDRQPAGDQESEVKSGKTQNAENKTPGQPSSDSDADSKNQSNGNDRQSHQPKPDQNSQQNAGSSESQSESAPDSAPPDKSSGAPSDKAEKSDAQNGGEPDAKDGGVPDSNESTTDQKSSDNQKPSSNPSGDQKPQGQQSSQSKSGQESAAQERSGKPPESSADQTPNQRKTSSSSDSQNPNSPSPGEATIKSDEEARQPSQGNSSANDPNGSEAQKGDGPISSQQRTRSAPGGQGGGETFDLERDQVNLDHARKATDLILKRLDEQKYEPDPKLLEQMNWTPEDLKQFLNRWEEMKKAAESGDPNGKRRYNQMLRSLDFRASSEKRTVRQSRENIEGLNQDSAVIQPPPEFAPDFNATLRELNRNN
jgi:collagen type III alpha